MRRPDLTVILQQHEANKKDYICIHRVSLQWINKNLGIVVVSEQKLGTRVQVWPLQAGPSFWLLNFVSCICFSKVYYNFRIFLVYEN